MQILERKIDQKGRISIPAEFMKELGYEKGMSMILVNDHKEIKIKPKLHTCVFCGRVTDETIFNQYVCNICYENIKYFKVK